MTQHYPNKFVHTQLQPKEVWEIIHGFTDCFPTVDVYLPDPLEYGAIRLVALPPCNAIYTNGKIELVFQTPHIGQAIVCR